MRALLGPPDLPSPRLLVVRTDRLGETLLTLPVLHVLRHALPRAHLIAMVHSSLRELLRDHPDVDEVIDAPPDHGPWWHQAWHLGRLWRSWRLQTIVIANPTKAYHVASRLAGIPVRVGYDRKWGWCLSHRVPDDKNLGEHHEVEYNMRLLTALGLPKPTTATLQLPVREEAERRVTQLFEELHVSASDRVVAVHPWTSNPRKQWPVGRFRALLQQLAGVPGVRPILVGGPQERARVAEVMAPSTGAVADLVGRLSLSELAALLRRAQVLVSNDSGPMHVAAAVGTPVVALFGTAEPGSHPRRWGPWGRGHTVIHKPLQQVAVDDVLAAVRGYLT